MNEEEIAEMEDKVQQIAKKHGIEIVLHRAPEDPNKKREWTQRMVRLQVSMWIAGGARCAHCGYIYKDVDDFKAKNPRSGYFDKDDPNYFDKMFVCNSCWKEYKKNHNEKIE